MLTEDRILAFAAYSPGTDRGELGRELRLPAPTVVSAVRRLLASGELMEDAPARVRGGTGRRPLVLRRAGPATLVGLISWDGTALRAACLDPSARVRAQTRLTAPDPAAGIDGLERVIGEVIALGSPLEGHALRSVVISVPAPYLPGRGVPRTFPNDLPFPVTGPGDLGAELTRRCGLPVRLENDANLAALGELYAGGLRGRSHGVCLTLTRHGFGGALVVNGALTRGARGFAGELAHLQVDRDGPGCTCGGRGCLLYNVRDRVLASAQAEHDEPLTFASLPALAAEGDADAIRMLVDVGRGLGGPLAHLCTFLDPEIVLVGGSFGVAAEHVADGVRDMLADRTPPAIAGDVTVVVSSLEDAESHGAVETGRLAARA